MRWSDEDLLGKTATGQEALRSRSPLLPQRLRSLLIMVDGKRGVDELRSAGLTIGAPDDGLEQLSELGFVTRIGVLATPRGRAAPAEAAGATPSGAPEATAVASPLTLPLPPVAGVPADAAQRFQVARKFMNDTVVDALGLRAFLFTLKLEKCGTLEDLNALLPEYLRALGKARGEQITAALETRLRELLR